MSLWTGALVLIALFAGVGITTVGPGGVFVTAALYGFTDLSSAAVAGTASATFVATGLVGSAAYIRSGELETGPAQETALILSGAGVAGALLGTRLNLLIGKQLFGELLAAFLIGVALLLVYRETTGLRPGRIREGAPRWRWGLLTAVGGSVGTVGGLLGVGGPVVAVPALVALGMPMLQAVAVAQVQSIFLSLFAAIGYWSVGAVDLSLAVIVGVPQLIGVVAGWRLAHQVSEGGLRLALAVVLLGIGAAIIL
ncbi:MAG: sulfite exporter TauE/SafE family protein [Salinibacter sp.]